ncbi:hypothetical protein AMATHDRAFT_8414 [Amanita thiersii Skay4041]|uniref:Uncharacterized protein n=1 Tax=Amanita thiersii Skay4041 TaxID=703135 RepID=A0A2A9N895_9AGAR|nr:hypothetical protein AMATHDRAFT_8414 [Amanita thiersii Skay4041]
MSTTCDHIQANPDISGIGIRINLYVTTLLLVLVPNTRRTAPLLNVLTSNAGISGAALLITALIETGKHRLSLYHAIFIIHALFFMGISISPIDECAGKYKGNLTARVLLSMILSHGLLLLFTGYAFYVWATAPKFGQSPRCNDQIRYIILFAIKIRATVGWLRKLWMAGLGFVFAMMIILPLIGTCTVLLVKSNPSSVFVSSNPNNQPIRFSVTRLAFGLTPVYGIIHLELYVKANKALLTDSEEALSFGQIYALVMIISIGAELLHFILTLCGHGDGDTDD